MPWKEIAAWGFGFATIPMVVVTIVIGVTILGYWFSFPEDYGLVPEQAWMGGALFVAVAILSVLAIVRTSI